MIFKSKNGKVFSDSFFYLPVIPQRLNKFSIAGEQTVGHLKINNSLTYTKDEKELMLKLEGKTPKEIYAMLEEWDNATLLNAFFARDFEAGTVGGAGEVVDKLLVRRLSMSTHFKEYETIGEIPYSKRLSHFAFKDFFITSGDVYLYTIQPVTKQNHYGAAQQKASALNRYEYHWIVDTDGLQIQVLNLEQSAVNYNAKDGIVETIGAKTPHVNRFSNLDYKSFNISGTIASEFDTENDIMDSLEDDLANVSPEVRELINKAYIEKTGELPTKVSNSMRDYSYERRFREKVIETLNNGQIKLYKSPTDGMMLVKLTNVVGTPKKELSGVLYDFSATVTQIGEVTPDILKQFNINGVVKETIENNE